MCRRSTCIVACRRALSCLSPLKTCSEKAKDRSIAANDGRRRKASWDMTIAARGDENGRLHLMSWWELSSSVTIIYSRTSTVVNLFRLRMPKAWLKDCTITNLPHFFPPEIILSATTHTLRRAIWAASYRASTFHERVSVSGSPRYLKMQKKMGEKK